MRAALGLTLVMAAATVCGCANQNRNQHDASLGSTREPAPALEISKTAASVESAGAVVATSEAWEYANYSGQVIRTSNYRIFTTIEDKRILERMPIFFEKALDHYTSALGKLPKPDRPLETFLFQTRSQWQTKTQEMLPEQAGMFSNLGRGGFTTRGMSVLYYIDRIGTRDTFAIAAHEGWHQYTQQSFKHQLPVWLEEGVATYMEGYRGNRDGTFEFMPEQNNERRFALRDGIRRTRLIPLHDLLTRSPQSFLNSSKDSLLTYYAQVWALTHFLAEGEEGRYRPALETVLRDAAEGRLISRMMTSTVSSGSRRSGPASVNRVGPAVVQEYFNRDLIEFEKQYLSFIDQLVQAPRDGQRRFN